MVLGLRVWALQWDINWLTGWLTENPLGHLSLEVRGKCLVTAGAPNAIIILRALLGSLSVKLLKSLSKLKVATVGGRLEDHAKLWKSLRMGGSKLKPQNITDSAYRHDAKRGESYAWDEN